MRALTAGGSVLPTGIKGGSLDRLSMGEIMSGTVECSANEAKPLVKVYTPARVGALFDRFEHLEILQRQLGGSGGT